MKNLYKIVTECKNECDTIGIKYGNIIEVRNNPRLTKTWGRTKAISSYKDKNNNICYNFVIEISDRLLKDNVDNMATKNTIMHEILHTVDDCFNHGNKWKTMADKVNRAYGYNIKRCTSSEEKGLESVKINYNKNYVITCEKCGATVIKHRMSNFVKYPYCYSHKGCGGIFMRTQ